MFGISEFSAVINPPQVAILAVGKSDLKFNPDDTSKTQTEINFNMSFDERCVSLDRAAKFLNNVNYFLANPSILNEATQEF
jgi:pyruvate/2-oxoglutarate dehydrogenase complex dihydrolipoamide acyltransferase (E2) component